MKSELEEQLFKLNDLKDCDFKKLHTGIVDVTSRLRQEVASTLNERPR